MFGYIICDKAKISDEEMARYKTVYCGLCRSLKKEFGQFERNTLNFDMTFLALFLMALYEPEDAAADFRCAFHILEKRQCVVDAITDYAAHMTVAMAYYKCRDDWADSRSVSGIVGSTFLKRAVKKVQKRYPRQCQVIEKGLARLAEVEKQTDSIIDEAVNASGLMLSEVFVYKEDFWSNILRQFGYELGRFIYLMDAAVDFDKDKKKGNYNPIVLTGKTPQEMEPYLEMAIGNAAAIYEQLPMVQDEHLIRNILYGGVWQKYNAKIYGEEKAESHG